MKEFLDHIIQNIWGIIGVLVSGIGLFLAFMQLKKIANKTAAIDETYKKTIEDLENNEILTNISTVLQKIEAIKDKFQDNKIDDLKNDLAFIAKLLVTLQSGLISKVKEINLDTHRKMCNDLEVKIITGEAGLDKSLLKDEYIAFSDLELLLTKVQSELKFKKNDYGTRKNTKPTE